MEPCEIIPISSEVRRAADARAIADTYRVETLACLRGEGEAFLSASPGGVVAVVGNLLHLLDVECETLRETVDFDEVRKTQKLRAASESLNAWDLSSLRWMRPLASRPPLLSRPGPQTARCS